MARTEEYCTIYSPENKGYWVGGFGAKAEFSPQFEAAECIKCDGGDEKMRELLDRIDPNSDSKIYWEERSTPRLPGYPPMQCYLA